MGYQEFNMKMGESGDHRKFQLKRLKKIHNDAYQKEKIYKKIKKFYDKIISKKEFKVGQKILLYHSQICLFSGKLNSFWIGPIVFTNIFHHGA